MSSYVSYMKCVETRQRHPHLCGQHGVRVDCAAPYYKSNNSHTVGYHHGYTGIVKQSRALKSRTPLT